MSRYFSHAPIEGAAARLIDAEAHHLAHVMRAKPGAEITLFDGGGAEFRAKVVRIARAEVELEVLQRREISRELPFAIRLAVALPKGERQRWLVEKAVELGVASLVPLETERGVAQPEAAALVRLRRAVVEASKQCGRNLLMRVEEPVEFRAFAQSPSYSTRLIAHPGGAAMGDWLGSSPRFGADGVAIAIGPEGGFSDDEAAMAVATGWQPLDLGMRILRIETAATLLTALTLTAAAVSVQN